MASGDLGTFNVKDFDVIMGVYRLTGFADEMIRVTQDEDTFTDMQGADGEISRVLRVKNKATIVISIMQTSMTNDWLSLLHFIDKKENKPVPFIILDRSGRTIIEAPMAWIVKYTDMEFGGEHKVREWTIRAVNVLTHVGGNS